MDFSPPSNDLGIYFSHLFDYSPKNTYGSCVFVSLIQVMSYYDSFYNDNVIPEQYDCNQGNVSSLELAKENSPGVTRQDYPSSPTALFSFVSNNRDTDLQAEMFWHYNFLKGNNPNIYSYIGEVDYRQAILNSFYGNNYSAVCSFIDYSQLGVNANYTDQSVVSYFDTYVKNLIDLGKPVILDLVCVQNGFEFPRGHAAVAYYYDSDGIHLNWGGPNLSDTDVLLSSGEGWYIMRATTISYSNLSESHSNNYISNNTYYCGCGYHIHNYQFLSQSYSDCHRRSCDCGSYYYESHNYTDHYQMYTNDEHKAFCECGTFITESHAFTHSSIFYINGHPYAMCLRCPAIIDLGNGFIPIPGDSKKPAETPNGSFVLPNGILCIDALDLELYFAGKLVIPRG